MKKKIVFPDWTGPACMMITGGGKNGKRPVWCEYTQTESDLLSLRVTVEIAGGFPSIFTRYETPEAKEAARLEEDRRAAWTNALDFAEQLWRGGTHRDFVVMFRQETRTWGRKRFAFIAGCSQGRSRFRRKGRKTIKRAVSSGISSLCN